MLYLLIHFLRNLGIHKVTQINLRHIIYFALLLPEITDIIVYTSLGVFPYKYFLLIFSLLAFFSVSRFKENKTGFIKKTLRLRTLLLCLILILCLVMFAAWVQDERLGYADSYDSSITPTCSGVAQFVNQGNVLTDLRTGGRLLMEVTEAQKPSIYIFPFSTYTIGFLYVQDPIKANELFRQYGYDYLVLSYRSVSKPIECADWLYSNPLGEAFSFFENYSTFNRVYDDGQGVVYKYYGY